MRVSEDLYTFRDQLRSRDATVHFDVTAFMKLQVLSSDNNPLVGICAG